MNIIQKIIFGIGVFAIGLVSFLGIISFIIPKEPIQTPSTYIITQRSDFTLYRVNDAGRTIFVAVGKGDDISISTY
jgi:hypothetical protein